MADLIGKTIGGYQIIEQIGRGGMATVYKAYQPSLDRDVAIKVLPPYYAEQDESFTERFKREARAIAKLRHPNILMVMDYGEEDSVTYIAMEYVEAGTLKDRMENVMTLSQIAALVGQIANALDYAHSEGVLHRDIKPSNILMPKPDWALLTDFGLAKMVGGSFMTQSGLTVGTPDYMSPEQGSGEKVDHRTDIYSLGVMLYEMVVGDVPYTAETPMAVVVKHIVDPLPMPRAKNPNIPEELQRVILKALAKDPKDRYQKAQEIVDGLQSIANRYPDWTPSDLVPADVGRDAQADRSTKQVLPDEFPTAAPVKETAQGAHAPKKGRRWGVIAGGVALISVCAIVAIAATTVYWPQVQGLLGLAPTDPAGPRPVLADDGPPPGPAAGEPDQPPPAFDDPMKAGMDALQRGDVEGARQAFRAAVREDPQVWPRLIDVVSGAYEKGDMDIAILILETGVANHPDVPVEDMDWLGWMYMEVGRNQEAMEFFRMAILKDPFYESAYYGYQDAAFSMGMEHNVMGFFEDMREQHPDVPVIYQVLADLYMYFEDHEKAAEAFRGAQDLAPEDPWVYLQAAGIIYELEGYAPAVDMLETAVDLAPEDPYVLEAAAWEYKNLGFWEPAMELFRAAIDLDPDNGWAHIGLAETLIKLMDSELFNVDVDEDEVRQSVQNAERIADEWQDPWLFVSAGWVYQDLNDCGLAVEAFERALKIDPQMFEAQEGLEACR